MLHLLYALSPFRLYAVTLCAGGTKHDYRPVYRCTPIPSMIPGMGWASLFNRQHRTPARKGWGSQGSGIAQHRSEETAPSEPGAHEEEQRRFCQRRDPKPLSQQRQIPPADVASGADADAGFAGDAFAAPTACAVQLQGDGALICTDVAAGDALRPRRSSDHGSTGSKANTAPMGHKNRQKKRGWTDIPAKISRSRMAPSR